MSQTKNRATINIPMPNNFEIIRIIDLICTGIEGEIGYWAKDSRSEFPEGVDLEAYRKENGLTDRWLHDQSSYQIDDFYLAPFVGGCILIDEYDERSGETTKTHRLDLDAIKRGLALMAAGGPENNKWGCGSKHFSDWVNENDDGITADVFIQSCLLGDIVYG